MRWEIAHLEAPCDGQVLVRSDAPTGLVWSGFRKLACLNSEIINNFWYNPSGLGPHV